MKQIMITGHLGKDAEILKKDDSKDFYTLFFSVAHTETYRNEKNQEVTTTDWFSCFKRYRKNPERIAEILKKGFKVCVTGKPTFTINSHESGNYVNITVNVNEIDFMAKSDEPTSKPKKEKK